MKTSFMPYPVRVALVLALLALAPSLVAQTAQDWADAPVPYPTLQASNGPRHTLVAGFRLGAAVDAEANGLPSATANGDDTSPAGVPDDEDGVIFSTLLVPGQTATITVNVAGQTGVLNAWIDFNDNGSWAQAGEQIFTNRTVVIGNNTLVFNVPAGATLGTTFARFRLTQQSFAGGFVGLAPSGEVEDYQVNIVQLDFGDAPNNYPTLLAANGARHIVANSGAGSIFLGARVDFEADGQPNSVATGDDLVPTTADDEDGVTFLTPLVPGQVCTGQVVVVLPVGATVIPGFLSGWIDFNGNGSWADAGEQIYNTITLTTSGTHLLAFTVPAGAVPGATFARFRLSTSQGISFNGLAPNGEVEDYQVSIVQLLDYGDAPDRPYPTRLASNGARHAVSQGFNLGLRVDVEVNGQPDGTATGDDLATDDEDGVTFSAVVAGQGATASVTLNSATGAQGRLDAWMDFNGNGSWADAGEQIFTSVALNLGVNNLAFSVPASLTQTNVFARFRLSRQGGLSPTGAAPDGEVEDYLVAVSRPTLDFGDAPQQYPTALAQNGARHTVLPGLWLGAIVDLEADGVPSGAANSDDTTPAGAADDEDGVTFTSALVAGQFATVSVQVTFVGAAANARLYAWIDFNGNGSWADPGEQIFNSLVVNNGVNALSFNVPSGTKEGTTFARFRVTTQTFLSFDGPAANGEVEDYAVNVTAGLDFGDAPEPYPTLLAQNGARHIPSRTFVLGDVIDDEADGQPSATAVGDDNSPGPPVADDEDGVQLSALRPGQSASAIVRVSMAAGQSARLDGWIDFNRDGDWADAGEQIFVSVPVVPGDNTLTFSVPATAALGSTFARFRLSRQGGLSFTGGAPDGEVEDYSPRITSSGEPPDQCSTTCKGTDFWLAFPANYAPDPDNPLRLTVCILGTPGTKVNVSYPDKGFSQDVVIPASMGINVAVPNEADLGDAIDVVQRKAVRVTASAPVSVYAESHARYTTDGYLALPDPVLGRAYVVQSFGNLFPAAFDLNGSQFAIVACQTNTRVLIRPRIDVAGHAAGAVFEINLNEGETYQLRATNGLADLSGTLILADKPIGVYGSHRCANVPSTNVWFCDYLVEQLLPATTWGQTFVTFPLATRDGDTFRCQAVVNGTKVFFNGVQVATLNQGESYQALRTAGTLITADQPISVTQYANSGDFDSPINVNADPFMVIVPPTPMFSTNHMVCTAPQDFTSHYLNVVVPSAAVGSVRVDGVAPGVGFVPIAASGYSGASIPVAAGVHTVSASAPASVTIYGWAEYDSYGWPGCLFFGDTTPPTVTCLISNVTVTLQPGSTAVCSAQVPDLRGEVRVSDDCSSANGIRIDQEPPPGSPVGGGVHPIRVTATDQRGNVGSCIITLTVLDPSDPRIFCPSNIVVRCKSPQGTEVNYTVPAQTACGTPLVPVCDPPSGSLFPPGSKLVTCITTNDFGKQARCEFVVRVRCLDITANPAGGALTITWSDGGTLETTSSLGGRWSRLPNATSPFTVETSNRQQFFRIRYE